MRHFHKKLNPDPAASTTPIKASTSLPSANNVDITDIPTGFSALLLSVTGLSMDTATRSIQLLCSTDNGSSFDTTNYNQINEVAAAASGSSTVSLAGTPTLAAAETMTYQFHITGYEAGPFTQCHFVGKSSSSNVQHGSGIFIATARVNALRIIMNDTGNFDAGTYALHGIR